MHLSARYAHYVTNIRMGDPVASVLYSLMWGFALLPLDKDFDAPLLNTLRNSICEYSTCYKFLERYYVKKNVMIWKRSAHLEPNIWSFTFVQTCTYALACYVSLDSSLMVCNVCCINMGGCYKWLGVPCNAFKCKIYTLCRKHLCGRRMS
ncbi:hypothetical protein CMV_024470 [Castanea mollissima]|uniref:Uncharacterized protein n=1 Tax=Castanea mollissima TaxID=60419 RepID=A0A8J4QRG3_9ROSI|nr:hypothetical protein CMV_024470 [Castanea mollissima]